MMTALVIMVSTFLAAATTWGAWQVDQQLLRREVPDRGISSTILIAISAWTIPLILLSNWLEIPGYVGPVQYWNDGPGGGMVLFNVRAVTMLMLMVGFPFAVAVFATTVAAFLAATGESRWRRCLVPAISLVGYFIAGSMLMEFEFFPSV